MDTFKRPFEVVMAIILPVLQQRQIALVRYLNWLHRFPNSWIAVFLFCYVHLFCFFNCFCSARDLTEALCKLGKYSATEPVLFFKYIFKFLINT